MLHRLLAAVPVEVSSCASLESLRADGIWCCFAADIADPKTNSVPKLRQRMMEDQARLLELEKAAGDGRSYAAVVASLADKDAAAAAAGSAGAAGSAAAGDQAATKFPDGSSRCVRLVTCHP